MEPGSGTVLPLPGLVMEPVAPPMMMALPVALLTPSTGMAPTLSNR